MILLWPLSSYGWSAWSATGHRSKRCALRRRALVWIMMLARLYSIHRSNDNGRRVEVWERQGEPPLYFSQPRSSDVRTSFHLSVIIAGVVSFVWLMAWLVAG